MFGSIKCVPPKSYINTNLFSLLIYGQIYLIIYSERFIVIRIIVICSISNYYVNNNFSKLLIITFVMKLYYDGIITISFIYMYNIVSIDQILVSI